MNVTTVMLAALAAIFVYTHRHDSAAKSGNTKTTNAAIKVAQAKAKRRAM
jgi:hypothetical protein